MPLSPAEAIAKTKELIEFRNAEQRRLKKIDTYVRDEQTLDLLPPGAPDEVHRIARKARVNIVGFVVNASTQSLIVDGLGSKTGDVDDVWNIWQANRMDARQMGIHADAIQYGVGYAVVLPGDPVPVIRDVSPLNMTAVYGFDDDWPRYALERKGDLWRLYDDEAVYWIEAEDDALEFVSAEIHNIGVTPVVQYKDTHRSDGRITGIVEPLFALQDQINLTTFNALVAQHYGAFRQRYIVGMVAPSELDALKMSAARLLMINEDKETTQVGEFNQTDLSGYLSSIEAALRQVATISQTPVHELLGLANLSNEALITAHDAHNRRLDMHRTCLGESHEQTLGLAARLAGSSLDVGAWVQWRDMSGRSLAQVADAYGKLTDSLSIPKRALWPQIAAVLGVSQDEVDTWAAMADDEDSIGKLSDLLSGQIDSSSTPVDPAEMKAKYDALGVAIRAGVEPADAAASLGLDIAFTGAVPASLRLPEAEAATLEPTGGGN